MEDFGEFSFLKYMVRIPFFLALIHCGNEMQSVEEVRSKKLWKLSKSIITT